MPAGFKLNEFASFCRDLIGIGLIGKHDEAVGIADIKLIVQQGHAEGLVEALHESLSCFGHTIAIAVAQQCDAVWAIA